MSTEFWLGFWAGFAFFGLTLVFASFFWRWRLRHPRLAGFLCGLVFGLVGIAILAELFYPEQEPVEY